MAYKNRSCGRTLKIAKYGTVLLSLLLCTLGVLLMAVPDFSLSLLCRLGGGLLVVFGGIKIAGYLSRDLYRLAFQFDLAFGILFIILGLFLLFRAQTALSLLCLPAGLFILADALLKVQTALDARAFGLARWWMILTAALVTGAVGVLLLLKPWESVRAMMVLLGVSFFAEGLLNLVTVLTAVQILKRREL